MSFYLWIQTKTFIEQRLSNCQALLVGIAVAGKTVAGAVGIPFSSDTTMENEAIIVYYGQIGMGPWSPWADGFPIQLRGPLWKTSLSLFGNGQRPWEMPWLKQKRL
jgi:hypothetical protein